MAENSAWVQGKKQDELAATAGSLLDSVDDPKFANSEVNISAYLFVRMIE